MAQVKTTGLGQTGQEKTTGSFGAWALGGAGSEQGA
jgi:hypothetical protein